MMELVEGSAGRLLADEWIFLVGSALHPSDGPFSHVVLGQDPNFLLMIALTTRSATCAGAMPLSTAAFANSPRNSVTGEALGSGSKSMMWAFTHPGQRTLTSTTGAIS